MGLIGTGSDVGTWPENIARGVRELGLQAEVREHMTLDEVARFTADGSPMIALGQVWRSQKSGVSAEEDWDDGHYITVLAVDEEFVCFQDPYLSMGKVLVTRDNFVRSWHQIMGGRASGNRPLEQLGILIRGEAPRAPVAKATIDPRTLDYARMGSLNLIVTRFDRVLLPFDIMNELRDLAADALLRLEAVILVCRDEQGNVSAMQGGRLEEERDAAEVSVLLAVLANRALGQPETAREVATRVLGAVGAGDFGLPASTLRALAATLEPGSSALVTLFENVWERRFREVAGRYGGEPGRQQLAMAAEVAATARELLG